MIELADFLNRTAPGHNITIEVADRPRVDWRTDGETYALFITPILTGDGRIDWFATGDRWVPRILDAIKTSQRKAQSV